MSDTTHDSRYYVWDTYWDANRLHSFGIEPGSEPAAALDKHWAATAPRLAHGATVLDIACGNGAAGLALLRAAAGAGTALSITGIDEAMIDPPRYVAQAAGALRGIDFRPRIIMEDLPFPNGTFDAAVSQFGIEFGTMGRALTEAARVLKPKGRLFILALPAQGKAVQAARKAIRQARYLLSESPLFNLAIDMIQGYHAAPPETAEPKMQADLAHFTKTVETAFKTSDENEIGVLSAIVSCLYRVFTDRKTQPEAAQLKAVHTARAGLALNAARAQATVKAAFPDSNIATLRAALDAADFKLMETRPLVASGYGLLAYQVNAERAEPPAAARTP